MSSPKRPPSEAGSTLAGVEDNAPTPEEVPVLPANGDEAPGSTAAVRVEGKGGKATPLPPPRRTEATPVAPRKGLQVSLPEDEPAAPKPPPRRIAPLPEENRGRRGAWWDMKEEPQPEPAPDDLPGATAVVEAPEPAPEPEPEPEPEPPPAPPEALEPEVEPYRPVPADDYQGHVPEGPPRWKVWLRRAAWTAGALFVAGVLALIGGYLYISREIPTFDSVRDYHPFVASKVVAADGTVVGQFHRERRTVVKMEQIPRVLIQAMISAEDKDFYKHPGINVLAIARAIVVDALSGRRRLGASTITQQVVKNFFLTPEKKWKRKLKEILLAARLERNLSKDDILFLYLNQINFGKARYGVEEASLYYFNKHVEEIDVGEAAILAGLPQNPSRINPRRHPERAKKRQIYVLDRMLANHYISAEEHDREVEKPIVLPAPPPEPPGAWYVDEVRRQLIAQFGDAAVDTAGLTVEVAMDPKLQDAAEVAVREDLRAIDKRQGWRGPELKLERDRLDTYRTALGRRIASVAQSPDQAWVADLESIYVAAVRKNASKKQPRKKPEEADDTESAADAAASLPEGSLVPDVLARAARVRPLAPNEIYSGIVTSVGRTDAVVELAPGIAGNLPFASMTWARPFKPERATPAPKSPADVLAVGDVVAVRVAHLETQRTSSGTRVQRLELALDQTPLVEGAFVAMDLKTRGVLALVGGYDMALSSFNRATQAKRQPGSSFKPFLYAAAIDTGKYTPVTRVDDSPEVIVDPWTGKAWKPQNFEKDQFDGNISLRTALADSKNTVAVKLLLDVGLDRVRATASAAGLSSEIPQSYTAALGTGEVGVLEEVNAYATLASEGRRADPILIRKVRSRDGNVLLSVEPKFEEKLKPEVAYIVSDLLRSVIEDPSGTAHSLSVLARPAAGKTGTASEHRDAWFIGFTPSLLAGGWVGFDTHEMLGPAETGGHAAGPIWLQWMRAATAGQPVEEWPSPPPGVTQIQINRNTSCLAGDGDPYAVREVFMAGSEPTQACGEDREPGQEDWFQKPR
ncbi:MAG TPA: PBP1A family penicillin-binding protein [Myxococcales bacterium]|nr:PBP1A family penicillin-binding protein [Myxococcales bacterium]